MNHSRSPLIGPFSWALSALARGLIKGYQWFISPILPGSCRFYPTCSSYALEALDVHGPVKGAWLALKRIGRCHPWNDGGIDPVPGTADHRSCCGHDHKHTHTNPQGTA